MYATEKSSKTVFWVAIFSNSNSEWKSAQPKHIWKEIDACSRCGIITSKIQIDVFCF